MRDAVFLGDCGGGRLICPHPPRPLALGYALERVEMLLAERALTGNTDLHRRPLLAMRCAAWRAAACLLLPAPARLLLAAALRRFSRMMCPTAVFDAGTV